MAHDIFSAGVQTYNLLVTSLFNIPRVEEALGGAGAGFQARSGI